MPAKRSYRASPPIAGHRTPAAVISQPMLEIFQPRPADVSALVNRLVRLIDANKTLTHQAEFLEESLFVRGMTL